MVRRGWWRPDRSALGRHVAWVVALLLGVETLGCAGSGRLIPYRPRVSLISPWRYYDLWQALRVGRGVLIGTTDGRTISGKFLSGGARTIRIRAGGGLTDVPVKSVRYIINVIDLSQAREGAVAGGIIGFGSGFALAYATGGTTRQPASRPARVPPGARARPSHTRGDNKSSSGESAATGNSESTNSQSNANTTPTGSSTNAGQSSQSNAATGEQAASSQSSGGSSSSPSDPTATGSNTYDGGGSSSGGSTSGATTPTNDQTGQSNGNSTVIVNVGATEGSTSQSSAGSRNDGQPQGGSSLSPAWRMFFFSVGFAALGAFIGWAVGRTKRKAVPRVDYIVFPANVGDRGARSPDQYLADQIASPTGKQPAQTLLPGSRFDSPRSAMLFEQFAQGGTVIRLADGLDGVISEADARTFNLFPTVKNLRRAVVVSYGSANEPAGKEYRYLAVVTSGGAAEPTVSLQRLSPRDVIRLGTQVNLIQSGIIH